MYFNISNEVKIIYYSTQIVNYNDKGYADFVNHFKGQNVDESSRRQRYYNTIDKTRYGFNRRHFKNESIDTIQDFVATLILDYSGKQNIGNQEPKYEIRTVIALDSLDLQNKRNHLYNATLDTLEIDSIVNSVLIEVECGGFISNNYKKKYNKEKQNSLTYDKIIDIFHWPSAFSYMVYDTIIDNKYLNMPTHILGKMTHLCPNSDYYLMGGRRGLYINKEFVYISYPDFPLITPDYKKSSNSNLYKNPSVCCLIMDFSPILARYGTIKIDFQSPMYFATISPTPDIQTSSTITYYDNEKLKQIYRNGIYVYAESLLTKKDFDNRNFILATIIGFLFSMIIDILYRLSSGKNKEVNKLVRKKMKVKPKSNI